MSPELAQFIVWLLAGYAAFGAIFALAFVTRGIARVDPVAKESGVAFRILIFPGVAALWPLLLKRWIA